MTAAQIPWQTQYTPETRPWAVNVVQDMDPGDVAGPPTTATITDLLTGLDVSTTCLFGSPTLAGTVITQTVYQLAAGHNYRLMLTTNMGGSKSTSQPLWIACPY